MMRFTAISIVISLLFTSSGIALIDVTRYMSPNGRFLIVNVGDTASPTHHFELRRPDGSVVFSLKNFLDLDLPSFAENITWCGSSGFVALSVSTGKHFQDTWVISTASGKVLKVPTDDSDYQTRPIRWTRLGELVVETKAPFGGKADDDLSWASRQYHRTFRLRARCTRMECVYTGPTSYPHRSELCEDGYKPRADTTSGKRMQTTGVPQLRDARY